MSERCCHEADKTDGNEHAEWCHNYEAPYGSRPHEMAKLLADAEKRGEPRLRAQLATVTAERDACREVVEAATTFVEAMRTIAKEGDWSEPTYVAIGGRLIVAVDALPKEQ